VLSSAFAPFSPMGQIVEPSNSERCKLINRLAAYTAKEGIQFEVSIFVWFSHFLSTSINQPEN
jgi:hypothetical protein